jgi:uncharacterized protein (TIGR00730 family)
VSPPAICVYCASSPGKDARYLELARATGRAIAARGLGVVYGGASVGMMGAIADAALTAGTTVVGVLPHSLRAREIAHLGLTELHLVDTMHERKAKMTELSSAFLALPGGFGTLDELFETLTFRQLSLHDKPVGLLNVEGYYDPLLAFLDGAVTAGLLREDHRATLVVEPTIEGALDALLRHPSFGATRTRTDLA